MPLFCFLSIWTLGMPAIRGSNAAEPASFETLGTEFQRDTRPLIQQFCLECHSTEAKEGDLDLERFTRLDHIRRSTKTWQKVAEMLDGGEMPPQDAHQPSAEQRKQLRDWVERYLNAEAYAHAGDPGPVVLRRLSNAEYTYTLRDLTGVPLDPAREFPPDSAAGEGFTNTGNALVMSPSMLTKYFDAGKAIARHAVLLPDGIRFSPGVSPRDWSDEHLARIKAIYAQFSDSEGRLPLEPYLAATLDERQALADGSKTASAVGSSRGLNPKYLASLWSVLNGNEPSMVLDTIRSQWRQAKPGGAAALAADVAVWQQALSRFQNVGHMKAWVVPVNPVTTAHEIRWKIQPPNGSGEVVIYLATGDAGDGNAGDFVVWQRPRLVSPGRPDLLLRDVREVAGRLFALREHLFASAAQCLCAAAEVRRSTAPVDMAELARRHNVDRSVLEAWMGCLGIGASPAVRLDHFTNRLTSGGGYDFIQGWGSPETPNLVANSSDQHVRIPGNMKPHGVAVHPSPTLQAAVGWRSPITGRVQLAAKVTHAHPECGNGITWSLEVRRGATRQRLAAGTAAGGQPVDVGPFPNVSIQPGDLVSLLIGPRDGNHACDLTDIEVDIRDESDGGHEWNLTRDVSGDVLAANPHADRFGHEGVWHFYTEPVSGSEAAPIIPAGSLLARWQSAAEADEQAKLADDVQHLLTAGPPLEKDHPDAVLYRQLSSFSGPLLAGPSLQDDPTPRPNGSPTEAASPAATRSTCGLDPALFGHHPNGSAIDAASLCVQAPSVIEIHLPADLVGASELVTTGVLHPETGTEGSVQLRVLTSPPDALNALRPDTPVLVSASGKTRERLERACDEFRRWFPAALCYNRIVPVDEVITLTLFHREDEPLCRLMLDDAQHADLDRLWSELHFVSRDALTTVDAFGQLMEYATQDSDPRLFEPLRKPILERAEAFRRLLADSEPRQLEALVDFAARAYRRPLTDAEAGELRGLYRRLRQEELPHDQALRLTLARVLVAPSFLYRLEQAAPGEEPGPVTDWELASRLSYFLWSSMPDAELHDLAAAGRLHEPDVLAGQARRMLRDARVRRLATEFACQWLHIYDFDSLDEKSERVFPTFAAVRGDMYEESIRFFTNMFQKDDSVLSILDADHTFVNNALAGHYGIPGVTGTDWRRVDGVHQYGRGGVLGLGATLAKQSGASRTSPVLRGNWVAEVLLGEKLPRPPKNVPRLPEDETATDGLTVRQLVEKHRSDPRCAKCHVRIDPFGFALEGFDAIGRRRDRDLGGRPIDTHTVVQDGAAFEGLEGLRAYLLNNRRDAFLQQFCRKLLGYALGRGVQLSDRPLLEEMQHNLEANQYRFSAALEAIVRSRQFRQIRGKDAHTEDAL